MRNLAFVDVETTGLDSDQHEIWEASVILTDYTGFKVTERYTAMIEPKNIAKAEAKALEVNGYHTRFDVSKCVKHRDMAHELIRLTTDAIMVGQNVLFDMGFIRSFLWEAASAPVPWHYHSVDISSLWHPIRLQMQLESSSLNVLAQYLGIQQNTAHSAEDDVRVAHECYKALMARYVPDFTKAVTPAP